MKSDAPTTTELTGRVFRLIREKEMLRAALRLIVNCQETDLGCYASYAMGVAKSALEEAAE
jgi:hypothetical protein